MQPYGYYKQSYERRDSSGGPAYERGRYHSGRGYDRRARKRQQECYDAYYYYGPSFYDRYCRAGYYAHDR